MPARYLLPQAAATPALDLALKRPHDGCTRPDARSAQYNAKTADAAALRSQAAFLLSFLGVGNR